MSGHLKTFKMRTFFAVEIQILVDPQGRFLERRANRKIHRESSIQKEKIRLSPFTKLFRPKEVRKSCENSDTV